jgi:hypothetical protein
MFAPCVEQNACQYAGARRACQSPEMCWSVTYRTLVIEDRVYIHRTDCHFSSSSPRSLSTKEATRLVDLSLSWVSRAAIIRGPECQAYATQTRGDR